MPLPLFNTIIEREKFKLSVYSVPFFRFSVSLKHTTNRYSSYISLFFFSKTNKLLVLCSANLVWFGLGWKNMAIQAQLYTDNIGFPLGGSQDLMDNFCGFNQFYFNSQHQQQQPLQQNFQQQILPQKINQNFINVSESMPFAQSLATQIEKQRIEIDQFISLQNERMRLVLHEQRKQQLALIWRKYEPKVQFLLKQKEEEIAKASNRTKELEDFLKKLEIENQAWQKKAMENEAIVISLNNTIEQLRETVCLSANGSVADDAESCCNVQDDDDGDVQHNKGNGVQETRKMICKSCSSRNSCMIFLPCRHLSSCKECDSFLHQCPVCGIGKKASIEALI